MLSRRAGFLATAGLSCSYAACFNAPVEDEMTPSEFFKTQYVLMKAE